MITFDQRTGLAFCDRKIRPADLTKLLSNLLSVLQEQGLDRGRHYEFNVTFDGATSNAVGPIVSDWRASGGRVWAHELSNGRFELGETLDWLDSMIVTLFGRTLTRAVAYKRTTVTKISIYSPEFLENHAA